MSNSKYKYYFPENIVYRNMVNTEDIPLIAQITGYKKNTVGAMLNGHRKLKDNVKEECLRFARINNKKLLKPTS